MATEVSWENTVWGTTNRTFVSSYNNILLLTEWDMGRQCRNILLATFSVLTFWKVNAEKVKGNIFLH